MTEIGKDAHLEPITLNASLIAAECKNRNDFLKFIHQIIKSESEKIHQAFWRKEPIDIILNNRARVMDEVLKLAWTWFEMDHYSDVALFAVGGYGNMILHPFSDIDTLIITNDSENIHLNERIEKYISFLWDCNIQLGSSVRTLSACKELASNDHVIFTTLLTCRYLIGSLEFLNDIEKITSPQQINIWPFAEYFQAKLNERLHRYQRYQNTEYNQEPNLKESPGGLRDIDFIYWIAKRKFGKNALQGLISENALSEYEIHIIESSKQTFWQMRYALHLVTHKSTDRLYLEYQSEIAKALNIDGQNLNQSVSNWMQKYFLLASQTREITDIFAQHFSEQINKNAVHNKISLSTHCKQVGHNIEIVLEKDYYAEPHLFINLFYFFAKHENLIGLTANSRRFIYDYFNSQYLPDFLNTIDTKSAFLSIFQFPRKVAQTLTLMHQLGVLSKLITCFAELIGQMQYDLNHIYTVDAHTLRVLQYIQDFYQDTDSDLPFLTLSLSLANDPIILYIAGLFHDIGKGRGGDHSEIGRDLALEFCQIYGLTEKQTDYITWLVFHHLKLSHFAQRKDINDPMVIVEFSKIVQSQEKLCYLYLLTIADIKGTNPKLWNHWRKALLSELFNQTYQYFDKKTFLDNSDPITYKKEQACGQLLKNPSLSIEKINGLWSIINSDYFENTDLNSLVWQTAFILSHGVENTVIATQPHWNKAGTDIFVYSKDCLGLFAYICQTLEKLLLTIVEAKVTTTKHGFCLNSMVVLESSGQPITGPHRLLEIKSTLSTLLDPISQNTPESLSLPYYSRHVPRWYRYYQTQAKVEIYSQSDNHYSTIEIHAPDFPGLLARVGKVLVMHGLSIHSAKINTLGDKVIDFFYVSKKEDNMPLTNEKAIKKLKKAILQALR